MAWLLALAPGAPLGPEEVEAYVLLEKGSQKSCAGVFEVGLPETTEKLYRGAAAACLAGIHGRSVRWREAEEAFDDLGGEPDGCLNKAVYALLRGIVTTHREFPQARIQLHASQSVGLPCPTLDSLAVSRDASGTLAVDITGKRLAQVLDVAYRFVECPAEIPELDDHDRVGEEGFSGDSQSIQATIGAESAPAEASSIWVGLIAHPDPWIADAGCVPINPLGEDGNGEASATPDP